jgi:hypothetical protein
MRVHISGIEIDLVADGQVEPGHQVLEIHLPPPVAGETIGDLARRGNPAAALAILLAPELASAHAGSIARVPHSQDVDRRLVELTRAWPSRLQALTSCSCPSSIGRTACLESDASRERPKLKPWAIKSPSPPFGRSE